MRHHCFWINTKKCFLFLYSSGQFLKWTVTEASLFALGVISGLHSEKLIKMWAANNWAKAEERKEVVWWGFCRIMAQSRPCRRTWQLLGKVGIVSAHPRESFPKILTTLHPSRGIRQRILSHWLHVDWGAFPVSSPSFPTPCVIWRYRNQTQIDKTNISWKVMAAGACPVIFFLPVSGQKNVLHLLTVHFSKSQKEILTNISL